MADEMVTISKVEHEALLKARRKLEALEFGGVDNWEWYGEALKDFWAEEEKIDPT